MEIDGSERVTNAVVLKKKKKKILRGQ